MLWSCNLLGPVVKTATVFWGLPCANHHGVTLVIEYPQDLNRAAGNVNVSSEKRRHREVTAFALPSLGGHSFLGGKFWSFSCCSEMLYHILNPSLLLGLVLHTLLFYPLDLSDFPFSSDFFKITGYMRDNPHTVKFTILKCLIQWFQYNHKVMHWSTPSNLKHFHHPWKAPYPLIVIFYFSASAPAPSPVIYF